MNELKLKHFTPENTKSVHRKGEIKISLNEKTGLIQLSAGLVRKLDLKIGDKLDFVQDQNRPNDWYICIKTGSGFILRYMVKSKKYTSMAFNCVSIVRSILGSIDFTGRSISIPVSTEPVHCDGKNYYAILTSVVKNEKS